MESHYSGRITKSYWAWISGFGLGELVEIERTLKAPQYYNILNNVLLPSVEARFGKTCKFYVIEDNSTVHRADISADWYAKNPRFVRLQLPPKSPDINVIENFWAEMVREWRPLVGSDKQGQLQNKIQKVWDSFYSRADYFKTLTDSMPRRLKKIIEAKGGHVNY